MKFVFPKPTCGHQYCNPHGCRFGADLASTKDSTVIATFKGSELVEYRDFRDRGDPMEKVHPDPNHWSRPDRPDDTPKGR